MNKAALWANPDWRAQHWGSRRGIPWSQAQHDLALQMRADGAGNDEIAEELERSVQSVNSKIGYVRRTP